MHELPLAPRGDAMDVNRPRRLFQSRRLPAREVPGADGRSPVLPGDASGEGTGLRLIVNRPRAPER